MYRSFVAQNVEWTGDVLLIKTNDNMLFLAERVISLLTKHLLASAQNFIWQKTICV